MTDRPPASEIAAVRRRPARAGGTIALFASLVVAAAVFPQPGLALLVVVGGVLLFGTGLLVGRRALVTLGTVVQLVGLIGAGIAGLPVGQVLLGLAALLVAWDLGQYAIVLGEQVGTAADSMRAELLHAGTVALVVAATAVVANGLFVAATGGQPLSGLVALTVAAVLLLLILRN